LILAKVGWFRFGFEPKTTISVSVRFSDPEWAASATRAAHDPAPNVSAPPPPGRRAPAALKRSVHQFSNYSSTQVIFKGAPNLLQTLLSRNTK